jgi:hypothetical protein
MTTAHLRKRRGCAIDGVVCHGTVDENHVCAVEQSVQALISFKRVHLGHSVFVNTSVRASPAVWAMFAMCARQSSQNRRAAERQNMSRGGSTESFSFLKKVNGGLGAGSGDPKRYVRLTPNRGIHTVSTESSATFHRVGRREGVEV